MRGPAILVFLGVAVGSPGAGHAQASHRFTLELEAGPVWQSRNDVRIPNDDSATRFSLRDLAGAGAWPAGRLYLRWNINERHSLRALAAPLSFTETGRLDGSVRFAGASLLPGSPTRGTYRFNSWRLSWIYRFHHGERWTWRAGFTAKIRDADIELRQSGAGGAKSDVGFVPLVHLSANRRLAERWSLDFDLDALAGGPGRAEDLALKLAWTAGERWTLAGGYRTVEGGADVDSVFAFAWLHYAVVSAAWHF